MRTQRKPVGETIAVTDSPIVTVEDTTIETVIAKVEILAPARGTVWTWRIDKRTTEVTDG